MDTNHRNPSRNNDHNKSWTTHRNGNHSDSASYSESSNSEFEVIPSSPESSFSLNLQGERNQKYGKSCLGYSDTEANRDLVRMNYTRSLSAESGTLGFLRKHREGQSHIRSGSEEMTSRKYPSSVSVPFDNVLETDLYDGGEERMPRLPDQTSPPISSRTTHINLSDGRVVPVGRGKPKMEGRSVETHVDSREEIPHMVKTTESSRYPRNMPLTKVHAEHQRSALRSGSDEDGNDVEDAFDSRQDQIEQCKNEAVLQAKVVIKDEAWMQLMNNRNLCKSFPKKARVKEVLVPEGEKEMKCHEIRGNWRDVDIVTSLVAEAVYNRRLEGMYRAKNMADMPISTGHKGVRELSGDVRESCEYMETDETSKEGIPTSESSEYYSHQEQFVGADSGARPKTSHFPQQLKSELDRIEPERRETQTHYSQQQKAVSQKSEFDTEMGLGRRDAQTHYSQQQKAVSEKFEFGTEMGLVRRDTQTLEKMDKGDTGSLSSTGSASLPLDASKWQSTWSSRRKNRTFNHYNDTETQTTSSSKGKAFFTQEGLVILVYEGDITNLSAVDCIVNSTDPSLKHFGGAAAAIKNAAGLDFEKDCRGKVLSEGKCTCIATGAGKLPYKKVLHVSLPEWNQSKGHKILQATIDSILKKAKELKMKSLAMSAIGTGGKRYPVDMWVTVVLETLRKHSKYVKNKQASVTFVHIVDHRKDVLKLLSEEVKLTFPDASCEMVEVGLKKAKTNKTHAVTTQKTTFEGSSTLPATFDIGQLCKLFVNQGDITEFRGDAIIITEDRYLATLGPLAKAVASAAGEGYKAEKQKKKYTFYAPGDVVTTTAGQLQCRYILHGICGSAMHTSREDLKKTLKKILHEANSRKLKTVAFPALFTGNSGLDQTSGCESLVREICDYIYCTLNCSLREVYLLDKDVKKAENLCMAVVKYLSKVSGTHLASSGSQQPLSALSASSTNANSSARHASTVLAVSTSPSKSCQVIIESGDITQFTGDAVVIVVDKILLGIGYVGTAVTAAAGEPYRSEINKKNIMGLQSGDVVETKAGHLQCEYIIHGIFEAITEQRAKFRSLIVAILRNASNKFRAIAIPAIWKDLNGISYDDGCEIVLEGISQFLQLEDSGALRKIYILDTDGRMVDKIRDAAGKYPPLRNSSHSNSDQMKSYSQAVTRGGNSPGIRNSGHDGKQAEFSTDSSECCVQCEKTSNVKRRECGHYVCGKCTIPQHGCWDCRFKTRAPDVQTMSRDNSGISEDCSICLSPITNPRTLPCSHTFCSDCVDQCFKSGYKICPICKAVCGTVIGNQPEDGVMTVGETYVSCAGYEPYGSYIIDYSFRSGIQKTGHPHPGKPYKGANRRAFLPKNSEGKKILNLLRKAFDQRLVFTVGQSVTTGRDDTVTWNDIHHKTAQNGDRFGYPDPTYLARVREELKAKGITDSEGTEV